MEEVRLIANSALKYRDVLFPLYVSKHPKRKDTKPKMEEVRLLCSYGGSNRMLRVHRNITFEEITAELSAVCGGGAAVGYFKYELNGLDDLDTLVSVTNDRDVRNMMREFDFAEPDYVMRIFPFLEHRRRPRAINALEHYWRWIWERVLASFSSHIHLSRVSWACWLLLTTVVLMILLQQNSVMDIDNELKSVVTVAELGPGADDSLNQQRHIIQPHHESLPYKAAGGVTGFDPSNAADFVIFINFRGKDTRISFVCHLYEALLKQRIKVLIDYKLTKGQKIWPSLLIAIESSHLSLVVFSQDYASSKWCLKELVKILETMKQQGQIVLTVFYKIDPSHVRYQLGSFEQAFETHVQKFDPIVVQNWKTALTEAADLIGWDSNSPYIRDDADLIQQIVKDVLEKKKNHHCKLQGTS